MKEEQMYKAAELMDRIGRCKWKLAIMSCQADRPRGTNTSGADLGLMPLAVMKVWEMELRTELAELMNELENL